MKTKKVVMWVFGVAIVLGLYAGYTLWPIYMSPEARARRKIYLKQYGARADVKARNRARAKRYYHDPRLRLRWVARWMFKDAVISGKLHRVPCVKCGATKAQGHHEDYSKPLVVIWLCDPCHRAEHKRLRKEMVKP